MDNNYIPFGYTTVQQIISSLKDSHLSQARYKVRAGCTQDSSWWEVHENVPAEKIDSVCLEINIRHQRECLCKGDQFPVIDPEID
jgi:hypothetical protein